MKKIIYLLSIALLSLSCSSDSDSNPTNNNSQLVGKWQYFQGESYTPGTTITGNEPLENYPFKCPTAKDYMQMFADGGAKLVNYNNACQEDANLGTWEKQDIILRLTSIDGDVDTWEIISLSDTNLKIKQPNPSTGTPQEIIVLSFIKV